jgi:hypothetical protein
MTTLDEDDSIDDAAFAAEAERASEELADHFGISARVEPQPISDYERDHPPASPDDLRRLAGLPSSDEEPCGMFGPNGQLCRLAKGHSDDLHAAQGRTWTSGDVAKTGGDALTERLCVAIERHNEYLERLTKTVEHYVQHTLHTQKF